MSLDDLDVDKIWMNGEFINWEDAKIHALSHSLHYGTAVFNGLRCYDTVEGPAIFRPKSKYEKFFDSAKGIEMDLDYTIEDLIEATKELIRLNGLDAAYIRPISLYGYDELGLNPSRCPVETLIACWPWGAYLGEEAISKGVDVAVSSWRRIHSSQVPIQKLSGLYINSIVASLEAKKNGYTEAIILDKEGNVAEGPGENIFLVKDGQIYIPDSTSSRFEGVTEECVIEIAQDLGYEVTEREMSRKSLYKADELFFTGTAAEVTPIRSVDDREIGTRGPITEEIQSKYFEIIEGGDERYHHWLDYI
jgi:branched-chain amino acid aminotransferase